jgi:type I restriction enzyme S subunit
MSSSAWHSLTWGEIATLEYGKSLRDYKESSGAIPVYGTNGLIGYTDKALCCTAGVIVGRKGAYRGIHYSGDPFYVIDTAFYLKPKFENLNMKFAYYQLLTQNINDMDSGSAIPSTSREDFYKLGINLPDIETQTRIAMILSAFDEKIENNRQINKTLEAMSQAIFKEWFVNFNYPGATGDLEESELGLIPKGWGVSYLGDLYKTTSGGTPSRDNLEFFENGTVYWIKSKELNNSILIDAEEKITSTALRKSSAKLLPAYSVLIAMYGATVGKVGIISMEAACNQAICAFLENRAFPYTFVYHYLKSNRNNIISRAVGSAQQNISQELLKQMEVVVPPELIRKQYHHIVHPMIQMMKNNAEQIRILTDLRDALLPKFMSGELIV